ncbi:MAG: CerR family C-terminal domain-containing protein [Deltaproteobacteria bacterium]|nr:CerR family C-terminal domain-containing protein [Deltaproteobacteria bacterium]
MAAVARNAAETRQRVIDAASALFAERGFHATTVRDIARRAGVNLAAAHYHFGSKDTLYLEVMRTQFDAVMQSLAERRARFTGGRPSRRALVELLRERVAVMLEMLLGPPPGLPGTLMLREMLDPSAALPDIVRQFVRPHKDEIGALVARLAPRLDAATVERCVFSIVGQIFFYRTQLAALPHLSDSPPMTKRWIAATAAHITSFSLGGMRAAAARSAK